MKDIFHRLCYRLLKDPTLLPPPAYKRSRADEVYGEAFRRCFEYLTGSRIWGDILEFGTLQGFTARKLAMLMREFDYPGNLYLYDSFEGLPEIGSSVDQQSYEVAVNKVWFKGQMKVRQGIEVAIQKSLSKIIPPERLIIVKGYYQDTLKTQLPVRPAALVHLDCDLYDSAKLVLETLLARNLLQDGCLLLFDDYNCNRANPKMGERRAFTEAFEKQARFSFSTFFAYGWGAQAFFVHERDPALKPFPGSQKP